MNNRSAECIVIGVALLITALLSGCGPSNIEKSSPPPELVSLSITPVNLSIAPGTTAQFKATGTFSNRTQSNLTTSVTWSSLDSAIATVSNASGSRGTVTGSAVGSTAITAVFTGITGTSTIAVSLVSSITVTPPGPLSIAPGTTQQFAASGTLENGATQNLTTFASWTASPADIAAVSNTSGSKGLVTALAAGSAGIQASYGGTLGIASLTTSSVASIAVTPATESIPKGTTQQFAASGRLENGAEQSLTTFATWTTSNSGVATISNLPGSKGLATGVGTGSSAISALFGLISSPSATLTVTDPSLVSMSITPADQSINLGVSQQFIATGLFSDNTSLDITSAATWHSSNTAAATISNLPGSKGLATSVSQGTTIISASLSGITSDNAALTVTPAALASIVITPASASIVVGDMQRFTATGIFTDGNSQDLTSSVSWASSDTTIATISNTSGSEGLATAFFIEGSTSITASLSGITSSPTTLTVHF